MNLKLSSCIVLATCLLAAAAAGHAQTPSDPFNYSRTSAFTYDPATGVVITEAVEPGAVSGVVTTYAYDAYGNKKSATVANYPGASGNAVFASRASTSVYAAQTVTVGGVSVMSAGGAFATQATNPLNQSESHSFDPRFGAALKLVGPNGLATSWQVDDFGRPVRETRADGTSTVTSYCLLNSVITDVSSNSASCPVPGANEVPANAVSFTHVEPHDATDVKNASFVRTYLDGMGRKIRTIIEAMDGGSQPRLIAQDTDYNAQGATLVATQSYFLDTLSSTSTGNNAYGMRTTTYDSLGRPTAIYVIDPKGSQGGVLFGSRGSHQASISQIIYSGLTTTTINDLGQYHVEEKNVNGQVVRATDAGGAQIAYQYDAFDNLVQTKDALQNVVSTAYDVRGRRTTLTDPDTGVSRFDYDALGEVVWQQSANQAAASQATTLKYDTLGRVTQRVDPEYTSNWYFDNYASGAACTMGIGKLCESRTTNGVARKSYYDSFGRAFSTRTDITSGPSFVDSIVYDKVNGRPYSHTYPTGLTVDMNYTTTGALQSLTLETATKVNPLPATAGGVAGPGTTLAANSVLWQALAYSAAGTLEKQLYGNGVVNTAVADPSSGRVTSLTAGTAAATNVMNYAYDWDSLSHMRIRTDANGDGVTGAVSDNLYYDSIGRLQTYTVSAPAIPSLQRTVTMQYNPLGMVTGKSDVGTYTYLNSGPGVAHPHALQSVAGAFNSSYAYDANGNLTTASAGAYRTIHYTSFNLPDGDFTNGGLAGPSGSPHYGWQYDENHQRVKETEVSATGTRTTWMLHPDNAGRLGFESEQAASGVISNRHYLSAGGHAFGVLVSTGSLPVASDPSSVVTAVPNVTLDKVEYWHQDYLGSLVSTTDQVGAVTQRYAYDPFGKRRVADGNYDANGTLVYDWNNTNHGTDRGYTGHEHLDDVGVIHMNGRLYDPRLGIFMQADPFIQDPLNLQNFNRYGYCYNNPMTCSDPTGQVFGIDDFFYTLAAIWIGEKAGIIDAHAARIFTSIAVAFVMGPSENIVQAAQTGFVSGAIATGNIKGALQGAFSAGLFNGVGSVVEGGNFFAGGTGVVPWGDNVAPGIALHGVVGCITSVANGGKCGAGALSASFGKAITPISESIFGSNPVAGLSASIVAGGTASVLGGGKFSNGAQTAAFGYLFNHWAHVLELALQGIDAHQTLQNKMEDLGYDVERQCSGTPCVDGRFDIASPLTHELWEIKRYSLFGMSMGEIALNSYTDNTGFVRGGDLPGLAVDQSISLRGEKSWYTFKNVGGGLIVYSVDESRIQNRFPYPMFWPLPVPKKQFGEE